MGRRVMVEVKISERLIHVIHPDWAERVRSEQGMHCCLQICQEALLSEKMKRKKPVFRKGCVRRLSCNQSLEQKSCSRSSYLQSLSWPASEAPQGAAASRSPAADPQQGCLSVLQDSVQPSHPSVPLHDINPRQSSSPGLLWSLQDWKVGPWTPMTA